MATSRLRYDSLIIPHGTPSDMSTPHETGLAFIHDVRNPPRTPSPTTARHSGPLTLSSNHKPLTSHRTHHPRHPHHLRDIPIASTALPPTPTVILVMTSSSYSDCTSPMRPYICPCAPPPPLEGYPRLQDDHKTASHPLRLLRACASVTRERQTSATTCALTLIERLHSIVLWDREASRADGSASPSPSCGSPRHVSPRHLGGHAANTAAQTPSSAAATAATDSGALDTAAAAAATAVSENAHESGSSSPRLGKRASMWNVAKRSVTWNSESGGVHSTGAGAPRPGINLADVVHLASRSANGSVDFCLHLSCAVTLAGRRSNAGIDPTTCICAVHLRCAFTHALQSISVHGSEDVVQWRLLTAGCCTFTHWRPPSHA